MTWAALLFLACNAAALLFLPRRYALIPLLVGACYVPVEQVLQVGPISLPALRILILIGAVRMIVRRERIAGALNKLDWLLIAWAVWACFSSLFHEAGALENRLGMVWDSCGIYFLIRAFVSSMDDVVALCRSIAIVLVPVSLEMVYEHFTMTNLFSFFTDIPIVPELREGHVRASGPFAHAILAGTVGASMFPLMVGARRYLKRTATLGIVACATMVITSASSSPIVSAACAGAALVAWKASGKMRWIRWAALLGYVALDIVMKAPAYYLLARVDIAGGSTGWHRARLIEAALEHFGEWWLIGTDYTRHWIAYGVPWTANHIDITNHYLKMGVLGGLPLMLLLIAFIAYSFAYVGRALAAQPPEHGFLVWSFGAAIFAHVMTSIAVSYFDQSLLFFYLPSAVIASILASARFAIPDSKAEAQKRPPFVRASVNGTRHAPTSRRTAPMYGPR